MTFSQFAQVLEKYCSDVGTRGDFIVLLTDKIMGGRPGRAHKGGGYQNPMRDKDARSLLYFYSGERSISKPDAKILLRSVDKYKFEEFLQKCCSEDALNQLRNDLENIEAIPGGNIVEVCADLFEQILKDLAER